MDFKKELMKENDQRKLSVILGDISSKINALKSEFNSLQEKKIIEALVGNNPIITFAQSFSEKKKSMGELLFGETDYPAYFEAIKEYLRNQEQVSQADIIKEVKQNHPDVDNNEQRMIRLLEQIISLLQSILVSQMLIIKRLECGSDELQSNNG